MSPAAQASWVVTVMPGARRVEVPDGATLLDALVAAGAALDSPCGGKGTCGKCRVDVRDTADGAAAAGDVRGDARGDMRGDARGDAALGRRPSAGSVSRRVLACRTAVSGPVTVELGAQGAHAILASSGGGARRSCKPDPEPRKRFVSLEPPSLSDQRSDLSRLKAAAGVAEASGIDLSLARRLPGLIRDSGYSLTALVADGRLVGAEPGDTSARLLGMAFDIGTTTLVGFLVDLESGVELAASSALNPQVRFGADVVSRSAYASREDCGLERLRTTVAEALDGLIGDCVEKAGVARDDVYSVSVVGNTCMHHLFLGLSPRHLSSVPFTPALAEAVEADPAELGLRVNPAARLYALPVVAGFVGADTVAVVLSTGMDRSPVLRLAIDIGTNGEMVLGSSRRMVACSTAAGPAFEGAQIGCGMRGAAGAIDHANLGPGLSYTVIGGGRPRGICGSGLLDLIACLVRSGAVNSRGRILAPEELPAAASEALAGRIVELDGARAFVVEEAGSTAHGEAIVITQKDIGAFQLAKGAIAAGVSILMETLGVGPDEVGEVLLAGAFGTYLEPESAAAVGLIPASLRGKARAVGNAAGSGAVLAVLSRRERARAAAIARRIEHVELAAVPSFGKTFGLRTRFD